MLEIKQLLEDLYFYFNNKPTLNTEEESYMERLEKELNKEHICPRCYEDWYDENNKLHKGHVKESQCIECGVCKNCEHLQECSKSN